MLGSYTQSLAQKIHTLYRYPSLVARQVNWLRDLAMPLIFSVQIEQWNEQHYPSFVLLVSNPSGSKTMMDPSDPRARIVELQEAELAKKKRTEDIRAGVATNGLNNGETEALLFVAAAMVLILGVTGGVVWFVMRFF